MTLQDSISLSWKNVRSNTLRTVITVIIMALGIFALILIITAIKALSNSLTDSFSTMGSNSFSLRYKSRNIRFGHRESTSSNVQSRKKLNQRKSNFDKPITYDEAIQFKERYHFPGSKVSIALRGASGIVVNTLTKKTNPEINIFGGDENYLDLNGYDLSYGRNFTPAEIQSGRNVCMLGSGVAARLFPDNSQKAIDAIVSVDHIPYRVIGVMAEKSSSAFFNTSKVVVTPYNNVRRQYASSNASYVIAINVPDIKLMDVAIGEATGTFRPVRKLAVTDDDNFAVDKSDNIAKTLMGSLSFVEKATMGIALITLIGAAIGLMNIMLVAVNERTKEIGLVKAIGGTRKDVQRQFLFESIIISMLGAVVGIISGVLVGNFAAVALKTSFVVPWVWVFIAIVVCTGVGLLAGLYPAYKAAKLDPIVALRYE